MMRMKRMYHIAEQWRGEKDATFFSFLDSGNPLEIAACVLVLSLDGCCEWT